MSTGATEFPQQQELYLLWSNCTPNLKCLFNSFGWFRGFFTVAWQWLFHYARCWSALVEARRGLGLLGQVAGDDVSGRQLESKSSVLSVWKESFQLIMISSQASSPLCLCAHVHSHKKNTPTLDTSLRRAGLVSSLCKSEQSSEHWTAYTALLSLLGGISS